MYSIFVFLFQTVILLTVEYGDICIYIYIYISVARRGSHKYYYKVRKPSQRMTDCNSNTYHYYPMSENTWDIISYVVVL